LALGLLLLFGLTFLLLFFEELGDVEIIFNDLDSLAEIIFSEHTLFVNNEVNALGTGRKQVVLQRGRPEIRVDHVARLLLDLDNPFAKLAGVGDCG